jgi:eukaryotic-like serine/threonine-protein kinase
MMTAVFQRIGPFEVVREIGRGGMATVFLAVDSRTGRHVALKLVAVGTDRESREVLEAEQRGARLHEEFSKVCRQVPEVYEYGTEGPYFYIAMEYVEGQNLSEVIARGALVPDRAVALAIELCRVLEAAHSFETTIDQRRSCSLIHGDLKPRNVRLTDEGQVKVLDFGIAKALSLSRRVTRNDFGSMPYLSPERLESDGDVDAQADCWAVGVLLYEMLSGEQPFRAADTRQLEKRIVSRQPPESLNARCPVRLQAIVAKLLAPQLSERYAGARTIREDLERFCTGEKTEAEREGWPDRPASEATRRTRPTTEEPPTRRTLKTTVQPPPIPPPLVTNATSRPPSARTARRRFSLRRALFTLIIFVMFASVANEMSVAGDARLDGLDEIWTARDKLAERSSFGLAVRPLEQALKQHTKVLTDRVISRYLAGGEVVWEPEWTSARRALVRAYALDPGNKYLRASLRYSEGHLDRINGEARRARGEIEAARLHLSNAVAAFREAAELRPDWPDPFLGLSRTFIYGLDDVDRGADALTQAQRRGYKPGERETLQLAHGFWRRAESLARTARRLNGLPQEQEYLSRAAEAYQQALTLYKAVGTPEVAAIIRLAQSGRRRVTERLELLADITGIDRRISNEPVPETR